MNETQSERGGIMPATNWPANDAKLATLRNSSAAAALTPLVASTQPESVCVPLCFGIVVAENNGKSFFNKRINMPSYFDYAQNQRISSNGLVLYVETCGFCG